MSSERERAVEEVRKELVRRGWPRVQMSLILLLTGVSGFLVSYALLHAGLTLMSVRYPLAILAAYTVFLLLLRFWLFYHGDRSRARDADVDLVDVGVDGGLDLLGSVGRGGGGGDFKLGGGGDFAGAGAGGSWGEGGTSAASLSGGGGGGGGGSFLGKLDFDSDDLGALVLVLIALGLILAGLVAAFYVVYAAPALLAEVALDGLLMTGLYKRLQKVERRHWLETAIRRTLLPVVIVTVLFGVAGYLLQRAAPEAHSIGGVWSHFNSEKR